MDVGEKVRNHAKAILCGWYPGALGGLAIARVISGKACPCGRLPITVYRGDDILPDITDYSMADRTYRYMKSTPLYPFGYGLTYSDIKEEWLDENTCVVSNIGNFDTGYSVLKFEYIPHKNLCGYKHIFLKAGEKAEVKF